MVRRGRQPICEVNALQNLLEDASRSARGFDFNGNEIVAEGWPSYSLRPGSPLTRTSHRSSRGGDVRFLVEIGRLSEVHHVALLSFLPLPQYFH